MADGAANSILTDDDLNAALAEVDAAESAAAVATDEARGATAESGEAPPIVHVPIPQPQGQLRPAAPAGEEAAADPATASAEPAAKPTALRFQVPKKKDESSKPGRPGAATKPPAPLPTPAPAGDVSPAAVAVTSRAYQFIDRSLDAINRPFWWLPSGAKRLVGLIAIVTLVTSSVALALPLLFPRRDAINFLHEKVVEMRTPKPPPEPAADHSKSADTHAKPAGAAPARGGH